MKKILTALCLLCLCVPSFAESIADLRKRAEAGHAEAQFKLGLSYYSGEGVPKDEKEAVKWHRKAATQGFAEAQRRLGYQYHFGKGATKDLVKAYAWYILAGHYGDKVIGVFPFAALERSVVAQEMTPKQIAKAQKLSKELLKKIEAKKE